MPHVATGTRREADGEMPGRDAPDDRRPRPRRRRNPAAQARHIGASGLRSGAATVRSRDDPRRRLAHPSGRRPAAPERTIEAVPTSEEAVVSKEARVTGEVLVRKQASDRTETVTGEVRSTKAGVEDGVAASTATAPTPGRVSSSGLRERGREVRLPRPAFRPSSPAPAGARPDPSPTKVADVERVPIGRVVDVAPQIRTEGDVTIIPVLQERMVVGKQLFLVEEVHITRRTRVETVDIPVRLRTQRAVVDRA